MSTSKKKGKANNKSRKPSKRKGSAVSQQMRKRIWRHQGR